MDSPENVRIVQRQAMNRSTFYLLLFVLSLLFINFSEDEAARQGRPTIEDVLDSLRHEKEALGNVTFGVNVTHVRRFLPLGAFGIHSAYRLCT